MLLELLQNPVYCINVSLAEVSDVNEYVIKVYYHKNIQLLKENFVDDVLETSRCIW